MNTALFGFISDFEKRTIECSLVVVVVVVVVPVDNGWACPELVCATELYGDPVPDDTKQPFVRRAENRNPFAPSTGRDIVYVGHVYDKLIVSITLILDIR